MLNSLRNASRTWVAKALLLLLVASFAVWGISTSLVATDANIEEFHVFMPAAVFND